VGIEPTNQQTEFQNIPRGELVIAIGNLTVPPLPAVLRLQAYLC
jgi:hypothetical protein